jgi:hypothetical protein
MNSSEKKHQSYIRINGQYLVTYRENGKPHAFYTHWFDEKNIFASDKKVVVYDLCNHKYMVNSLGWLDFKEDHL